MDTYVDVVRGNYHNQAAMTMTLDLTPLNNAVARLTEGLEIYARNNDETLMRDGLIQRFEFTYEVAQKTLRRALMAGSGSPEQYATMPFPNIIRSGNEQGLLLGDWPVWKDYRDMRGKTSHVYNEAIAIEVISGIAGFLRDAVYLRDRLQERAL